MINIPGNKVIVDSDALIGLLNETDQLHKRCISIFSFLNKNNLQTIVPYAIVLEAATALAKDKTIKRPDLAHKFLQDYISIKDKPSYDSDVSDFVAKLYNPRTSKKNTPFDHFVLALAKKNDITYVFSFDSFYKKNGLNLAEELIKKISS